MADGLADDIAGLGHRWRDKGSICFFARLANLQIRDIILVEFCAFKEGKKMKRHEIDELIRKKKIEIEKWAKDALSLEGKYRVKVSIDLVPLAPRGKKPVVDTTYVLIEEDWDHVRSNLAIDKAALCIQDYLKALVREKCVQFPRMCQQHHAAVNAWLKHVSLPFRLYVRGQHGTIFEDRIYRLYRVR